MKNKVKNLELPKGELILYKDKVEVKLEDETVWLTQAQIALLFGTKRPAITKHFSNIFKSKELNKSSVCSILEHTAGDGKNYKTQYYNLDAIISVGYRINSSRATQFRIWATGILRQHLVDGYTINEKRLKAAGQKYQELRRTVHLLSNITKLDSITDETKGLVQVISEYTKALDLLDDFDHERLSIPKGTPKAKFELTYEEAIKVIEAMKKKFKGSNNRGQRPILIIGDSALF